MHGIPRRKNEDRYRGVFSAHTPQDLAAVQSRQHKAKDDQAVLVSGSQLKTALPVSRNINGVSRPPDHARMNPESFTSSSINRMRIEGTPLGAEQMKRA